MARKRMVRPVEIDVEVTGAAQEPVRKRRTSHGVVCPHCQSEDVEIQKTQTRRVHPCFIEDREVVKKQLCHCLKCDKQWSRRLSVVEKPLP